MKRKFPKDMVFILCYISYVCIYAARLNLSMASPGMISGGILTSEQYGFLGSAFFVVYACGRLLNGMIGDRVAPWVMISLGLALTGAAIFTVCTFVFTSVQDRLSSGSAARLAPIMSALGIWLAVQAFAGIGF